MLIHVGIQTRARSIPWEDVLRPGRGLLYNLLQETAPDLGSQLHSQSGWENTKMVPLSYGAPAFPRAPRQRGVYTCGGPGFWQISSPAPDIAQALLSGLLYRKDHSPLLDWDGTAFNITSVSAQDEDDLFHQGRAQLATLTPVLVKGSGSDGGERKNPRTAWIGPGHPEFPGAIQANLNRKAQALGLEPVEMEGIPWVGAPRNFHQSTHGGKGSSRHLGRCLAVSLRGAPETLRALRDWGIGQANTAGFGWVK